MPVLIDLAGKKIGDWTVLRRGPRNRYRQVRWLCKCKCGKKKNVVGYSLLSGTSNSCGCRRFGTPKGKPCIKCGGVFLVRPANYSRSKYCPDCRYQRLLERQRDYNRKHYKDKIPYRTAYNRENAASINKNHRERWKQLTDSVIRTRFKRDFGIPTDKVTPGMIQAKREAMLAGRAVRKLRKEANCGARF